MSEVAFDRTALFGQDVVAVIFNLFFDMAFIDVNWLVVYDLSIFKGIYSPETRQLLGQSRFFDNSIMNPIRHLLPH